MSDPLPPEANPSPAAAPSPGRPRRRPPRRLVAAGLVLAAMVAVGVVVAGRGSSAAGGYRTATAAVQAVDQVLDRVATVEPVTQASVAFPVAGTVATVDVAAGDQVTTGQVLATLDTVSLEATVVDKQAALAAAELTLEKALNGEDVGGAAGASSGDGTAAPAALSSASSGAVAVQAAYAGPSTSVLSVAPASASVTSTDDELAAAQQAVLDAQHQVSVDMATAQQALDDAATVCAGVSDGADADGASTDGTGGAVTDPGSGTADGGDTDGTTSSTTSTTAAAGDSGVTACRDALDAVLAAQTTVAADQTALLDAANALDALLDERAAASAGSGGTSGDGSTGTGSTGTAGGQGAGSDTGSPSASGDGTGAASTSDGGAGGGTASGGQGGSSGAGSTTSSPSSEELIAYQKAVDAAAAEVTVATQAAAQATIVSPIAGTVQAVDLSAGDSVTAGSATTAIVVVGDGGYEVTTTVTVDDLSAVAVGQPVEIDPDGGGGTLAGEVVAIGVAGTTSGSTTTYPVTIGLTGDAGDDGLRNGATASVAITTDAVGDALAVPTSAVAADGGRYTVTVLDGGSTEEVAVEVGAMGDVWTEIVSGLDEGQRVVLADLDEPLPNSATDGSSAGTGVSGFPGGGVFPGGGGPPGA